MTISRFTAFRLGFRFRMIGKVGTLVGRDNAQEVIWAARDVLHEGGGVSAVCCVLTVHSTLFHFFIHLIQMISLACHRRCSNIIRSLQGACVGNFQHFEKHFESRRCATVRLEQNYRSSGIIVAAANSVIDKNKQRLSKTLFTDKGRGEKVIVTCLLWRQRWEENESVG